MQTPPRMIAQPVRGEEMKSKMFEPTRLYKPFAYPRAYDFFVESERMHWTEEELDLSDDVSDWSLNKLTPVEKDFVTQILRMFTQADLNVGEFYYDQLIPVFKNNEIRKMLGSFATREGTHQNAYALLNDTLGLPEGDYAAFLSYAEMKDKDDFMRKASTSTTTGLARALAKAVFNEGVSLFASFAMLLNFQRRGLMKGMGKVVEWSIKDESKHVEGVSWLFRQLCHEHPRIVDDQLKKDIYDMARECVALEDAFIALAYKMGPVQGLEQVEVMDYIRFIADRRLSMLGLKENWGIDKNPLPWIDVIVNAADHTNFFEQKVAEYEVASLSGDWVYSSAEWRIYGRDKCEFCKKAVDLFDDKGLVFDYRDLSDDQKRHTFYDANGFEGKDRRVPKIYRLVGDEEILVGGYTELAATLA